MTDEELDALVKQAMDRAIERLQKLHDYAGRPAWDQVICEELSEPITTLRAQLAEAQRLMRLERTIADKNADRADRAEAALAAQIEVDAGMLQSVAQPHDRTALDRMLDEAREKALREAAEILDDEGWVGLSMRRILALIEKPNAR